MILAAWGLLAFAATAAATWLAAGLARRTGLIDRPGPRKIHGTPTPLAGGVGIAAGVTVVLVVAGTGLPLLPAVWTLVVVGIVDDARDLRASTRLGAQTVAVLPAVLAYAPSVGAPRPLELGLALVSVLAIVCATKCIDCADGIAASIGVVGAIALGSLGGWDGASATLAVALAGAAGAFLLFNAPPARCFLGEAGSTVLGLLLATVALATAADAPGQDALAVAVSAGVVLAVPTLDFLLVHWRRWRSGCRRLSDLMASADTDHLPHRLRSAGLGAWQAVAVCAGAVALSGLAARLTLEWGPAGSLIGILVVAGGFLGVEEASRRAGARGERLVLSWLHGRRPLADLPAKGAPWS